MSCLFVILRDPPFKVSNLVMIKKYIAVEKLRTQITGFEKQDIPVIYVLYASQCKWPNIYYCINVDSCLPTLVIVNNIFMILLYMILFWYN